MSSANNPQPIEVTQWQRFNPLVIEACLRPTMAKQLQHTPTPFQSSRHRGMSSAKARSPARRKSAMDSFNPLVIEACLRPGHPRGARSRYTPSFNPLVIEACLRPQVGAVEAGRQGQVSILSSSRHVFGLVEVFRCAAFGGGVSILSSSRHVFGRTSRRLRYPLRRVSILSSSRHVFGRRFPDRTGEWSTPGFNPLVIEACLRPWGSGPCSLALRRFQSSRHRGMSSARSKNPRY